MNLNMSMLRAFFETGADASLFEGLYIEENKALCDEYMGKYSVPKKKICNYKGQGEWDFIQNSGLCFND